MLTQELNLWLSLFLCATPPVVLLLARHRQAQVKQEKQTTTGSPDHLVVRRLKELTSAFGTQWPPLASDHMSWTPELQIYNEIWHSCQPSLTTASSSINQSENWDAIVRFREKMRAQLHSANLSVDTIQRVLARDMSPEAWNSFSTCIAFLRHAYRWGIAPVVAAAQDDLHIDMPEELEFPWKILQDRYGFTSASGNLTTNVYFNLDYERGRLRYEINANMSQVHRETEYWNSLLFYEMERKAISLYHLMALSVQSLERKELDACHAHLVSGLSIMKATFKYFFDNLSDSQVNRALWMAYVQGFHGWSAGDPLEDGVSGGQSFFIRATDSFLGIRPFPPKEDLHLPLAERQFLDALRNYDIRQVAIRGGHHQIQAALQDMVSQLRLWRMGHMKRMESYEGVPRPERKKMTAGKSVVPETIVPSETAMLNHLRQQLRQRLEETK